MSKIFHNGIVIILLYLYIYSPPFRIMPFNISLLLIFPAFYYILKNDKLGELLFTFKNEIEIIVILCSYSFLFGLLNFEFSLFINNLHFLFQLIPVSFWFYYLIIKNKNPRPYNYNSLVEFKDLAFFLGIIAILASAISIIGFFVPELGQYFKFDLQKYDKFMWRYQMHRAFGIADELLFTYSIVQGIVLIIILYTSKNILLNIFCFTVITFSIIINARIGLIVFAFLPFVLFRKKIVIQTITACLIIIVITYFTGFYVLLTKYISGPLKNAASFFMESGIFLTGDKSKTFNTLNFMFDKLVVFPDKWYELLFGTGEYIFVKGAKTTDIGYLLMLNFGGIAYMLIFGVFVVYIFYRLFKCNINYPVISYLILFVFITSNIKGLFFAPKPGMKLIMLIYVFFVLSKNQMLVYDKRKIENPGEANH